jgi:hypothetical protein
LVYPPSSLLLFKHQNSDMKITTTLVALLLGSTMTLFGQQQSAISAHQLSEKLTSVTSLSDQWNNILDKDKQVQASVTSSRAIGSKLNNELSVLTNEYLELINTTLIGCKDEEMKQLLETERAFVLTIIQVTPTK